MSRLIFDADTLGGTTTLSSADAVGNFTLTVPAVNGTLSVKDATGDATFRNITLTGAVLAGVWNGSTISVPFGGTGATTLTGYVKGTGTSAMTASSTIPNTDITGLGTMSTQNANAVAISGGTISGLNAAIPVGSGGTGATTLTGYVKGTGTSAMTASSTIPNTDITGLGTMSTQGLDAVTITGGTANGLTIGASNPAAGTFTTLRFNSTLSVAGTTGTTGQVLTSNGASAPTWTSVAGVGTVTSVSGSGGTTGLTLTGGPITSSGTLTLGGALVAANGGTGATTLTGYTKGNGTAAFTASATIPNTDITGLGTMSTQAASAVAITGGAVNGTTVGATTPAAGAFTSVTASTTLGVTGVSTLTAGAIVQGLTVGRGAAAIASNTVVGSSALSSNTTGINNTVVGASALASNTTGINNTVLGLSALAANTTGEGNTATGIIALQANTTGINNTASGLAALNLNTTGTSNTATGVVALANNTTGYNNNANGTSALQSNTTGAQNVASGHSALSNNTTGGNNTALGYATGLGITTGSGNTVLGANVTGLAAALTNNIILSDGNGAIKAQHNGTDWSLTGKVGLNTSSPDALLTLKSTGDTQVTFKDTAGTTRAYIGTDGAFGAAPTGALRFRSDQGGMVFGYAGSEQMRLNTSGNVGIGTTSPNYKLEISTDSAAKPGVGGLWTVVSDERIKANIVPANLDRCYEIVKSVPLKHFGFAPGVYTDDQIQDKNNLGWIAQDVQKVFKNAVSVKPFTLKTEIPDGIEEYKEQDFTLETVEKTETSIQVINGKPVQVSKVVTSENKVMLFDVMDVLDETNNVVMDGDKPLTYQVPRMVTKTRPKVRRDVIEDCLDLNGGQMIAALYGAVQALIVKVELLETKLAVV